VAQAAFEAARRVLRIEIEQQIRGGREEGGWPCRIA
jgi:hypothetical protein